MERLGTDFGRGQADVTVPWRLYSAAKSEGGQRLVNVMHNCPNNPRTIHILLASYSASVFGDKAGDSINEGFSALNVGQMTAVLDHGH